MYCRATSIALVERPKDADPDTAAPTEPHGTAARPHAKSWTLAEVRRSVRRCAITGSMRAGCFMLRPAAVRSARPAVERSRSRHRHAVGPAGRVAVGGEAVEGAPKSRRSRRDLPLPADVTEALRALRTRQRREALELGRGWSDDRLVAVQEDGEPLRPESYTDEFQRLRAPAGLRRIKLHGLRNTSVSLMLDQGHPPHIVAAWHGHDPAVSLSIYADAKADELRAAGASLFG